MLNTVSTRDLQRTPRRIIADAVKARQPILIISNNKPQAAIISLDLLERMIAKLPETSPFYDLEKISAVIKRGLKEYKEGKTKSIRTLEELECRIKEIQQWAK